MRTLPKLIVGAVLLLPACSLVADGQKLVPSLPPTAGLSPTAGLLPQVDWGAYSDAQLGFTVGYPLTWQRVDNGGYPVKLSLQAAPGTTLLEKYIEINVTPLAGECRQSTYGPAPAAADHVQVNGIDFLRESGIGPAAGNVYDWTAYSTARGSSCITLAFVLHSADPGVYATEPPPFDKAAESGVFDEILNTFKFHS